ncbi:bile acid:sodium symporter family protein [Tundrisphaera sp. TA3]|uniref:bile acid:sodium symporter family protein n=1 Tax=Tundrisphaera sp. TA3 TaxID=3435775 RepID=UPI003EBA2E6E
MKFDWFLAGIAVATGLAWLFPEPGADGGWLHPELLTKAGVALIFFLHGIALAPSALKAGALRWPVHLVIQGATFLAFPLLGLALIRASRGWMSPDLGLGFFYLCALPSTVSSSVAMTAAARGSVPVAIFNATLSSLLGVVLTPLWIGWFLTEGGHAPPMGKVLLDLTLWLVLPLAVGQSLRPWLGAWAGRNKKAIGLVDRGTILLLVYTSFCDSVERGVWTGQGTGTIVAVFAGTSLILAIMLVGMACACRALGFPPGDRTAAIFCGSKKTLASGVPMAHLIFGPRPELGLILLPIMVYHPIQLVVCGMLASSWGRPRAEEGPEA